MKVKMVFIVLASSLGLIWLTIQSKVESAGIEYTLPENVKNELNSKLKLQPYNTAGTLVFLTLYELDNGYELILSVCEEDDDIKRLVRMSNRVVQLNSDEIPLILGLDLQFASILHRKDRGIVDVNIIILKGYSILFEKTGSHKIIRTGFVK